MFASSRPKALRFTQQLSIAIAACLTICGFAASTAAAASAPASSTPGVCAGQTFAQVFASSGDLNYYTLVPGGEFNSASEGWQLYFGARIVPAARPNGGSGGVLDLPSGAVAISPPECVTLQYPSARVWVRDLKGSEGASASVSYANISKLSLTGAQYEGQVRGQQTSWTASTPFNVQPQLGGTAEGTREVRFVFSDSAWNSEVQLYGLYVDPRMR